MAGVSDVKQARVVSILASIDQVDRLAESGAVRVWNHKHLRVIERPTGAEASA